MLARLRQTLVVLASTGALLACATLAGIEAPSDGDGATGAEPEDASLVVDGAIQTADGITIAPSALTLPGIRCEEKQSSAITITNNGDAAAPYEVILSQNQTFSLRGATDGVMKGTIDRGGFVLVYVDAIGSAPGPQSIDVVVKVGSSVQQINAKVDVLGGLLAVNPTLVDFGEVQQNRESAVVPIELKNEGNEQISVTGVAGLTSDFALSQATVIIPPNGTATVGATMTVGQASDVVREIQVTPQVGGALCAPAPALTLKGKRVSQDVTVGPLTADLGDFDCGVTPTAQAAIGVTNYSTSNTATYEAKLLSPASRFKIVSGGGGTVPRAANTPTPSKVDIVVGANTIGLPLGELDEDLEVKITAPSEAVATRIVKLHVGAYGAIIEVTPASLGGFRVNETKAFAIKNVGNARTCVSYSDVINNGFFIEPDDVLLPNVNNDLWVQFAAQSRGTYRYDITIARMACPGGSAPICIPPPKASVSATRSR